MQITIGGNMLNLDTGTTRLILQTQYALSKMIGEFASLQTVRGQVVATPSDF